MKKLIVALIGLMILTSLLFVGCSSGGIDGAKIPDKETLTKALAEGGYELVFEDEFEGTSLDSTVWRIGEEQTMRRGAYYTNDATNVFVEDGHLTIRTNYKKEGKLGAGWYTGWIESSSPNMRKNVEGYKGFSSKYGYYEVSCIAPPAEGIWSAFWMMPDSALGGNGMMGNDEIGTGRDGVEVDVMESPYYQLDNGKESVIHVIHGDGYGKDMKSDRSQPYNVRGMYSTFHRYGVMWTPEEYIFYIDGVETYRTKYIVNDTELGVSNVPEYMILSVEVAGIVDNGAPLPGRDKIDGKYVKHWAGNPNRNSKSNNYDFVVDYVRVFQIAE